MEKVLSKKSKKEIYYFKGGEKIIGVHALISGDVSRISGDVSRISGDVSGISGDVSEAKLTTNDRENGVSIKDLII